MWGLLLKRDLVLRQMGCCFLSLVKPLDSSGALDLAGGCSLAIFVTASALNEHLDFIRMKELCFKNNSCLAVVACVGSWEMSFPQENKSPLGTEGAFSQPCFQEVVAPYQ